MKTATLIATVSAAADATSAAFDLGDLALFSVEIEFSGADLVGTLTLQCQDTPGTAWKTVASSSQAVTASADHLWSISGAAYRYVRVFWDYTSGTGNITAYLAAKQTAVIGA